MVAPKAICDAIAEKVAEYYQLEVTVTENPGCASLKNQTFRIYQDGNEIGEYSMFQWLYAQMLKGGVPIKIYPKGIKLIVSNIKVK